MHRLFQLRIATSGLLAALCAALSFAQTAQSAQSLSPRADPLLSVDMNRSEIVDRLMTQWQTDIAAGQRESFKQKLAGLRADRLLAVSLVGSFDGVLQVLYGQEKADQAAVVRNALDHAKTLGDANIDLVYVPITPCRLIDTRSGQVSALGQLGGVFLPNTTRPVAPAGACGIPLSGVKNLFLSATTFNTTPNTGGYLAILPPGGAVTTVVDVFNFGSQWSSGSALVSTGSAGQVDVVVSQATADVILDVVGYFRGAILPAFGTVTSVATGAGLTGGPISTTGTIAIAPSFRLPQGCLNGQYTRFNNASNVWDCVTPSVVTNVATGPGLTGGPITATGTVGLATTQLLPTTACATNQIIKWNGAAWACASETASSNAWTQGGNAFGVPGVIGTTDNQEFKIVAGSGGTSGRLLAYLGSSSSNGMKMETTSTVTKPNTISVTVGSASNSFGFLGATVSGGGYGDINCYDVVTALTNKSCGNSAADEFAVVAGGFGNRVNKPQGTISGGNENTTEETGDTVGGGSQNRAWGPNATVSGGRSNQATFTDSTVSGGALNLATKRGSAVLGGVNNQATAQYATALGRGAVARNYGQFAHASNGEALASPFAPGNAQYSRMVLSSTGAGFTTNMGARPLALGVPAGDEQMRFLLNQSAFVDATVLAKEPGTSNAMAWTIKCIVMVDSAGTMTLSPSPCVPAVQQQTSALPWTLTTGQSAMGLSGTILTIRQNSPVGIKWVATVNVTELLE